VFFPIPPRPVTVLRICSKNILIGTYSPHGSSEQQKTPSNQTAAPALTHPPALSSTSVVFGRQEKKPSVFPSHFHLGFYPAAHPRGLGGGWGGVVSRPKQESPPGKRTCTFQVHWRGPPGPCCFDRTFFLRCSLLQATDHEWPSTSNLLSFPPVGRTRELALRFTLIGLQPDLELLSFAMHFFPHVSVLFCVRSRTCTILRHQTPLVGGGGGGWVGASALRPQQRLPRCWPIRSGFRMVRAPLRPRGRAKNKTHGRPFWRTSLSLF